MRRNVRLQCPQGHMLRELRPAGTCWAAHECRGWGPWGGLFQVRGQALLLFLSDLFLSLQVTDPTAGPHHDLIQPSAALRAPPTPTQRVHLGNILSRPAGSCTTTPPHLLSFLLSGCRAGPRLRGGGPRGPGHPSPALPLMGDSQCPGWRPPDGEKPSCEVAQSHAVGLQVGLASADRVRWRKRS